MAKIIGIARKERLREPELLTVAEVTYESGITGDGRGVRFRFGGCRQITILSEEQWLEACAELGIELSWQTRRANLLVEGFRFGPDDVGKVLSLGDQVKLKVTGETKPCSRMDEACVGLKAVLESDWRGGITCLVIDGGTIRVDEVIEKT